MKMLLRAAITFTIVLAGWPRHAKAVLTSNQPAINAKESFPLLVEVIPGKLRVKVFLHDINYSGEKISCWSYLTDGLAAEHQKEILFTLRRPKDKKREDYPQDFLQLFVTIYHYAERKQFVDVGDVTLFNEAGFFGDKTFRGLGYLEPESLTGVETGGVPLLAAIVLKGDEAQIAWNYGLTRVTGLIGMKYRYYPCPTWSDLSRDPGVSLRGMDGSLLGKIAAVGVQASYYEEHKQVHLSVAPHNRARLQEVLDKLPATEPLALRTQPDSQASACLVCRPGQGQPMAITRPGSDGSRMTGAFLAFVSRQEAMEFRRAEDGLFVLLTDNDWEKIRKGLASGSDVVIPPGGKDGVGVSLHWLTPKAYKSPVTGETYVAERWTTYEPQGAQSQPPHRVAVSASKVVLLTSEQELAANITVEDLAGYINRIQDVVDLFFTSREANIQRELTIQLGLTPEDHQVHLIAAPPLSPDVQADLYSRLGEASVPKATGPVKLELILNLWEVANKQ